VLPTHAQGQAAPLVDGSRSSHTYLCGDWSIPALILAVVVVLATLTAPAAAPWYPAKLVDCYDGDTCTFHFMKYGEIKLLGAIVSIQIERRPEVVRLCDINTPEVRGEEKETGKISRTQLLIWLQEANVIFVEVPQRKGDCGVKYACDLRDKYGRLLGWLWACDKGSNCTNLNARLVFHGLAEPSKIRCTK